jgi:hypothetical protein
MRVQVIKILSDHPKEPLVEFQSPYGIGRAIWAESVPELFQDYNVEYEIPETLVWGETIVRMDKETMAITYEENVLLLYGQLEHVDEDGLGIVRLGESTILVEIEALEKGFPLNSYVRLFSKQAVLYDTHS